MQEDALKLISAALEKVVKRSVAISLETDLIVDEILDSLDSMVFALEVEALSGKKFPEDVDLVDLGYFRIPRLIKFLSE